MYPCPMDKIMLEFMGVDAKTFQQKACDDTEEALARWIAEQCQNRSPDEMTAVNQKLLSSQPDNPDSWQSFYEIRDGVDASRTDITTWAGLIDLDEGRC